MTEFSELTDVLFNRQASRPLIAALVQTLQHVRMTL